jgi:hypothetical protein
MFTTPIQNRVFHGTNGLFYKLFSASGFCYMKKNKKALLAQRIYWHRFQLKHFCTILNPTCLQHFSIMLFSNREQQSKYSIVLYISIG